MYGLSGMMAASCYTNVAMRFAYIYRDRFVCAKFNISEKAKTYC